MQNNSTELSKAPLICEICGSYNWTVFYRSITDYVTNESFSILRCSNCGVGYTSPCPSEISQYYPPLYRQYSYLAKHILCMLYKRRVLSWHRLFYKAGSALEIGCGSGFMLAELEKLGWEVNGIERTDKMAQMARKQSGISVIADDVANLPNAKKYDLIILFQVLEHMAEPLKMLQKCSDRLAPGGRIIIGVPNIESMQSRIFGPNWFHLDVPRHLCHFASSDIEKLFSWAGLKVENIRYESFEHDPYGWIQSLFNSLNIRQNNLTRYLMGIDKISFSLYIQLFFGVALFPLAILCSISSWFGKCGAIMEVRGVRSNN